MAVARVGGSSSRRWMALAALTVVAGAAPRLAAPSPTVPVRIRVLKGAHQGPPAVDPRLADLHGQLGRLAYQRWDEVGEQHQAMAFNQALTLPLPDGTALELTLLDARKDTVTFEVKVPAAKRVSRLTIAKDQRIVHQVTPEKDGAAYFVTIRPWP